jgi:Transcriptional regulators
VAVTIKDVAREARVSVASVSRALNGHSSMTERTRGHILGVAARLRYVPHAGARSLIMRRTHTIGALLPDLHGEFFSELIRGIDLAAVRAACTCSCRVRTATSERPLPRCARCRGESTACSSCGRMSTRVFCAKTCRKLPTVLMNTSVEKAAFSTLNLDNLRWRAGDDPAPDRPRLSAHRDGLRTRRQFRRQRAPARISRCDCAEPARVEAQIVHGDFTEESGYRAGKQLWRARNVRRRCSPPTT